MRNHADDLVTQGNRLQEAGDREGAETAYRQAARLDPSWSVPPFNLGLLCKRQGRWQDALAFNQRAVELNAADQDAWWNLGIAATALGEWGEARRAWVSCGISVPDGEGPPDMQLGSVPVRLDPEGHGEVVWTERIDPARARLRNVPLPHSGFRWGDLVLNDGAPNGYRVLNGKEVPVFDVLARLETSCYRTFVVQLGTADPSAIEALEQTAASLGGAAENWGTSTSILCRECSLGVPHAHPESDPGEPANPHCGIAARDPEHLQAILERWMAGTPAADVVRWSAADE